MYNLLLLLLVSSPLMLHLFSVRSVTSVTMGVGELDVTSLILPEENLNRPFLILDMRDPDLFSRSHISLAVNYPAIRSDERQINVNA